MLGCCLGGQILARALGGTVRSARRRASTAGSTSRRPARAPRDPLFSLAARADPVYLWHEDEFTLPPGAVHLATSDATPVQAFRHGRAWGLQFHPECDLPLYDSWHGNVPRRVRDGRARPGRDAADGREREARAGLFAVRLLDAFASVVLT